MEDFIFFSPSSFLKCHCPSDWNPGFVVKWNIFWIKFYIWREIAFRCWPALAQCCTCGSDRVILVQTVVWSSLTKHSWQLKEAFALCDYMDCLKYSSCAVFFLSWFFFFFLVFSFHLYFYMTDRHPADAVENTVFVQCHHHRTLLILMIYPSQACHVEFPSPHGTFRCIYRTVFHGYLFMKCVPAAIFLTCKVIPKFIWDSVHCRVTWIQCIFWHVCVWHHFF